MPDLDALLWPRSIALVGASPDTSIIRGRVLAAVRQFGFAGPIFPVSRSHAEIDGLKCYPSVADLPAPADLAIITIPSAFVADALEACGEKGVRAAVIISSHLLALVEDLCSQLLILNQGRCLFFGPLQEARTRFADLSTDASLEEIFFRATEK